MLSAIINGVGFVNKNMILSISWHANTKADSLQEIEEFGNVYGILKILTCIYEPINEQINSGERLKIKYICMIVI